MPIDFTPPRATAAGESLIWVFPTAVNSISGIAGLVGDGSVFRVGPDISGGADIPLGYGTLKDYNATGSYPGGTGEIDILTSSFIQSGGGFVWGGFDVSDIPLGATINDVYGVVQLTNATAGYPDFTTIDMAAGRLSPTVSEMWNYDGSGGANNDSKLIGVPNPSSSSGPSGQFTSASFHAPIDPVTGLVDWSILSVAARLYQTLSESPNQTLNITGMAVAIYASGGHAKIAIGHGANLNAYDNGGYLAPYWPPGNGELLFDIEPLRNWCRANGISISLGQDSQRSAKDMVDEFLTVANSAPVYSGDKLKTIPYDEVSAVGNGAVYIAPTASGPICYLTDKDYAGDSSKPPVVMTRKRRASCDNVVAIEHIDRNLDYAHNVTSEPDAMGVALWGPRKGGALDASDMGVNMPSGSKSLLSIHNAPAAQKIGSVLTKRNAAGVNQYEFTLKPEWMMLEAMDLVAISDSDLGLVEVPVRLTSVKEKDDRTLDCTADEFEYGLNHPDTRAVTNATGNLINVNVDPGLVNDPIIFEPPAAILPPGSTAQAIMLVSGADPNYGGCIAFVSVDGGATYSPLGNIGPAITGQLTADYPSRVDPGTTDVLKVDLSESNGSLVSQSTEIADGFADPCFVAGTLGSISVPFEVVCPTRVTMTAVENFSMDTYIRRAVQGTSVMDHPTGVRFGVINGQAFKTDIPAQWFGKTVLLKFAAYNKLGSQQNNLADCVAYPLTITGGPSAEVYVDGVAISFDDTVYVDGVLISGSTGVTVDGA